MGGNLRQTWGFYKSQILLAMLQLLCVQVVQTNINESSWRERKKKKQLANTNKQKICKLVKKAENIN